MASEMRRLAKSLLEERHETFASAHPLEVSRSRVERALAAIPVRALRFEISWSEGDGRALLEAGFFPLAGTHRQLQATSIAITLLIACSAWAALSPQEEGAVRVLLPIFTVFAVLALPFVVVGLGSRREAEEAQLRRAIRRALAADD